MGFCLSICNAKITNLNHHSGLLIFFETGTLQSKLPLNPLKSSCLILDSIGITDMCHHHHTYVIRKLENMRQTTYSYVTWLSH